MASSLQTSSSGSKLGRSNAKKNISIFHPSDSPLHSSLDSPASFRILGMGSQEIRMIGDQIGIRGGPEEWGISPSEWRKGKLISNPQPQLLPVDDGPDDGDWLRSAGGNLSASSLRPSSFDGTSTSYRHVADSRRRPSRSHRINNNPSRALMKIESHSPERKPYYLVKHEEPLHTSKVECRANQEKEGQVISHYQDEQHEAHFSTPSTSGMSELRGDGNLHLVEDNEVDLKDMIRHSDNFNPAVTAVQRPLLPPPPVRVNVSFSTLSTHELLESFGPENYENDHFDDHGVSSDDESSHSDGETDQGKVLGDQRQVTVPESQIQKPKDSQFKDRDTSFAKELRRKASAIRVSTSEITIRSWKKLDLLGSGSFGTVYEGLSEEGIYFAVKEVSILHYDSKVQMSVKQLEQEIRFLSKFRHENIVRYLGSQEEPDKLYIFLELVSKGSLASLIRKHQLFDSQIRRYTRQILCGLKFLHDQNIVHRDIKCANILVDINGKIKVADFGLAKQISALDELRSCKGSAFWMAPEVINPTKSYSFPADIWSLGCTVLEMETRQPPFGDLEWSRAMWKIGHGEGPPIPQDLPEDAKDFIRCCLEVNPAKRWTAAQLLDHPFVQNIKLTPKNCVNGKI